MTGNAGDKIMSPASIIIDMRKALTCKHMYGGIWWLEKYRLLRSGVY